MTEIKPLKPRRFLRLLREKKCEIDKIVPATDIIIFDYNFQLLVCKKHLEELKHLDAAMEKE